MRGREGEKYPMPATGQVPIERPSLKQRRSSHRSPASTARLGDVPPGFTISACGAAFLDREMMMEC